MDLIDWLKEERGRAKRLAAELGVSSATISEWSQKRKPVPVDRCTRVEGLTCGAVKRQNLRADWQTHWPELAASSPLHTTTDTPPYTGNLAAVGG